MENNSFDTYGNTQNNTQHSLVPVYENTARKSLYIAAVAFLAGVLVGFGSYRVWPGIRNEYAGIGQQTEENSLFVENEEAKVDTNEATKKSAVSASSDDNVIIVSGQPAGNTVEVALVTVMQDSWVAIHEDRNGKPGNILGAQLFSAGTHSGTVELLRNTEEGGVYYATLRGDNGDRSFDYTKDTPITDASGKEISISFPATANPI